MKSSFTLSSVFVLISAMSLAAHASSDIINSNQISDQSSITWDDNSADSADIPDTPDSYDIQVSQNSKVQCRGNTYCGSWEGHSAVLNCKTHNVVNKCGLDRKCCPVHPCRYNKKGTLVCYQGRVQEYGCCF